MTWTCISCGWVNTSVKRRGRYAKQPTCIHCRTVKDVLRSVAFETDSSQYILLERNRTLKKRGTKKQKRKPNVMTHPDGTAW